MGFFSQCERFTSLDHCGTTVIILGSMRTSPQTKKFYSVKNIPIILSQSHRIFVIIIGKFPGITKNTMLQKSTTHNRPQIYLNMKLEGTYPHNYSNKFALESVS